MGQIPSFFAKKDPFYGRHEVEESNGECDPMTVSKCHKAEGHKHMIPVYEFSKEHIPEPFREDEDIFKITQSIAYITVRLRTSYVSKDRPNFIPRTNYVYPLFELRGESCYNTGTGRVCDVVENTSGHCKCEKCKGSNNPSKLWWTIKVFTATHVVYDEKEANSTTCTVFYDSNNKDQNKNQKVVLKGFKKLWLDVSGDLCLLETATCDKKFATEMFAEIKKFNSYWSSLKIKYANDNSKEKLVTIVSHPHGGEKRISFGLGVDIGRKLKLGYSKFIYTTPTCPGTSGGPVYILGFDWFQTEYVHGGSLKEPMWSDSDSSSSEGTLTFSSGISTDLFPAMDEKSVIPLSYSTAYFCEATSLDSNNQSVAPISSDPSYSTKESAMGLVSSSSNDTDDLDEDNSLSQLSSGYNSNPASIISNTTMDTTSLEGASSTNQTESVSNFSNVSNTVNSSNQSSKVGKYAKYPNYSARWHFK